MSNVRDELIGIQVLIDLIINKVGKIQKSTGGVVDMFHTDLTDVSNRLQTLIENPEEMLELDTQYVQDVYEHLCDAPMECTSMLEPPESRNTGIEQLISQLETIIAKDDEIEQMED